MSIVIRQSPHQGDYGGTWGERPARHRPLHPSPPTDCGAIGITRDFDTRPARRDLHPHRGQVLSDVRTKRPNGSREKGPPATTGTGDDGPAQHGEGQLLAHLRPEARRYDNCPNGSAYNCHQISAGGLDHDSPRSAREASPLSRTAQLERQLREMSIPTGWFVQGVC
jgi:hypothetical protein